MSELAERVALRVVSYAPGQLETVLQAVPYYRRTVMRKGAIRGLDADTPQVAVINVLVTHPRVPEATVREAVAAIVASGDRARPAQSAVRGDGGSCSPRCGRKVRRRWSSAACRSIPARAVPYRELGLLAVG